MSGYQLPCSQKRASRFYQAFAERWIYEYNIEWSVAALQELICQHRVTTSQLPGVEHLKVPLYLLECSGGCINEVTVRGTPGQCFQAQRTTAGKQIKASGAVDMGSEPVEEGLAHSISGRSKALGRYEFELTSAPLAADNTQLTLGRRPFSGSIHFVTLGKGVTMCTFRRRPSARTLTRQL